VTPDTAPGDLLSLPPPLESLRTGPQPARVGNVLIGTASWTEKTLLESGAFYPPAVKTPADRLRYYARHFPVVEVDATYYALPALRSTGAWAERTPRDFVFGVKAFAPMTGHPIETKRLDRDLVAALPAGQRRAESLRATELPAEVRDEIWRRFRAALEPLVATGKLGYVLAQMPPWFRPNRPALAYLDALPDRLPDVHIAVEFREAGWLAPERGDETLRRLRERGLAYVCVDEPQGTRASVPPVATATRDDLAVVRFHGRRRETWTRPGAGTTERFRYRYRPDELAEWTERLRGLAGAARRVYVLMNNCHRESAVQGAKDLAGLLAEAGKGHDGSIRRG
jgi:uncharacterized protein YecE (DUF72 family)